MDASLYKLNTPPLIKGFAKIILFPCRANKTTFLCRAKIPDNHTETSKASSTYKRSNMNQPALSTCLGATLNINWQPHLFPQYMPATIENLLKFLMRLCQVDHLECKQFLTSNWPQNVNFWRKRRLRTRVSCFSHVCVTTAALSSSWMRAFKHYSN